MIIPIFSNIIVMTFYTVLNIGIIIVYTCTVLL